jgi:ATP-dependent exoDNAse (exonuclease V) beta subunit
VDRLNLYGLVAQWGDAEIRRSNISGLLRLAKTYDDHCKILEISKPTYADFAKYMEEADAKTELNMTSNTVKILTMHKSKGLEWPIVVYYDKDNSFTDDDSIISKEFFGIREQRKDDCTYWLRVFPSAGCDSTMSPMLMTESYFEASKTRICADEERLRYVSLTRARDMLITINIDKDAPIYGPNKDAQKYQSIDTQKTHRDGSELTYAINPSKATRPKTDYKPEIIEAKRISLHTDVLPTTMSAIGTCIHTIYAAYDPEKGSAAAVRMAQTIIDSYSPQVRAAIRADEVIVAIESLYAYLTKTYGAPTATKHELPFAHLSENGQLVHGEIDLLWYTKDGVVLVDYKNTKKEEPNPEEYMGQLAAYSEAIKSAGLILRGAVLYYATLGKIITIIL